MRRAAGLLCLLLFIAASSVLGVSAQSAPSSALDYDIPGGHFYTQTNGQPLGSAGFGYSVTNDGGIPFWDAYQQMGGPDLLGYPVTRRFIYDGFVTQAMQKMVFQWRPETNRVVFLNSFDALHDKNKDDWLLAYRQTPKPLDTSPDTGLTWEQVVQRHQAFLNLNAAIKQLYFADPAPLEHYGLPVAYADMGNSFVIRCQRATFQYWKEDVPWAKKGDVSVANGGDLAKEAGLWPAEAVVPHMADGSSAGPASSEQTVAFTKPAPTPTPAPTFAPLPGVYRAASPEYGLHTFVFGHPDSEKYSYQKVLELGFPWHKNLLEWRWIEREGKGRFDWQQTDGLVYGSAGRGIKLMVRVDFPPSWARKDGHPEGPPDFYEDYADFIYALVSRYSSKNPLGRIWAIEIWNEPNLSTNWGGQKPDAKAYTRLLKMAYEAAKRADPAVVIIAAGLSPTGANNNDVIPDDLFLQQMYDAGARSYFDVLGAHAPGYKAPPEVSPAEAAANPAYGGHRSFTFRRTEDLRDVMVKNGDGGKQIWVTEFGWTSDPINPAYAWHSVTEEQKGQYIVRAFQWARNNWSPWIGVMVLWNITAPDWPETREEYWWSIVNKGWSPRASYNIVLQARKNGQLP